MLLGVESDCDDGASGGVVFVIINYAIDWRGWWGVVAGRTTWMARGAGSSVDFGCGGGGVVTAVLNLE